MTTVEEFRPRVRKGIQTIEAYEAGATNRIDLPTLDLYSHTRCALAQSIGNGDFENGRDLLDIYPNDDACAVYGFAIKTDETYDDLEGAYTALREAWVTELTAYRTAKAAVVAD